MVAVIDVDILILLTTAFSFFFTAANVSFSAAEMVRVNMYNPSIAPAWNLLCHCACIKTCNRDTIRYQRIHGNILPFVCFCYIVWQLVVQHWKKAMLNVQSCPMVNVQWSLETYLDERLNPKELIILPIKGFLLSKTDYTWIQLLISFKSNLLILNATKHANVTHNNDGSIQCACKCYSLRFRQLAWWRHQMETFSALLAICAGNSPVPGEFPTQRPVTWSFDVYFDLRPNKRLSKQSWGWWFETLSPHYDVIVME